MLCGTLLVTIQSFNLGIGFSIMQSIASSRSPAAQSELHESINAGISVALGLMSASFLAALMMPIAISGDLLWTDMDSTLRLYFAQCVVIVFVTGGVKFLELVMLFSFRGFERIDLAAGYNIAIRAGGIALGGLLVYEGGGVKILLLANLSASMIMLGVEVWRLRGLIPAWRFAWPGSTVYIRSLLKHGVWVWLQSFVLILCTQADRYIVSYIDIKHFSYYALAATLFSQGLVMISAITPWFQPRIAALKTNRSDTVPIYFSTYSFLSALGVVGLSLLFWIYEPLMRLWLGAEKFMGISGFIVPFIRYALCAVPTIVPIAYLNASGHQKSCFKINLLTGICTVLAELIVLYYSHNVYDIITILICGAILNAVLLHYAVHRGFAHKSLWHNVILSILPPATAFTMTFSTGIYTQLCLLIATLISVRLVYVKRLKEILKIWQV